MSEQEHDEREPEEKDDAVEDLDVPADQADDVEGGYQKFEKVDYP